MIRQYKQGGVGRATFEDVVGRICLVSDQAYWHGGKSPFRVVSDDGRAVIGHELKRTWVDADKCWKYSDEHREDADVRIDKSAIAFSCDTSAEAIAVMEVSRIADDEMVRARKAASARIRSLRGMSISPATDVRLLSFDDRDEWVNPDTGETLLAIPLEKGRTA